MQIVYTSLGVLFGLILLGALGLGAYWALVWMIGLFASLEPQVAALTGILSVLALLAAMILAGGADRAARQGGAARFAAERTAAYALFLDLWERLIRVRSDSRDAGADGSAEALRTLDLQLALCGSPALLKAQRALRDLYADGRLDGADARTLLAAALGEMRKELGADSTGLRPADLTRCLFPDWDWPEPTSLPERRDIQSTTPVSGRENAL